MKFINLIILVLIAFTQIIASKKMSNQHLAHHHTHSESKEILHFYANNAENYVPFARLAYCNKNIIQELSCSFCPNLVNDYATFFIHSVTKENNRVFQFVIVYSDVKREVIVSFSGPTTEHGNYFTSIFSDGFVSIEELGGIRVEKEYWHIYQHSFRDILYEKLLKISDSGRMDYTFVLVGHSFGGSIATLASYDLLLNNIIVKTHNSPLVYTYGPLRIGDADFVSKVNHMVKVVKILRKDDYVTRMPNCVFLSGNYKCFNNFSQVTHKVPLMRNYLSGYRRVFAGFKETSSDPIVRGTTFIGNRLVRTHVPMFYSQPLGTELVYNEPTFSSYEPCRYVNNVPLCERNMRLPTTFSPDVHRFYYNMNVEQC